MALPFPDKNDKGKRKWQCFVCGRQFENYELFKEHIIETHDEGRDYILCPLQRCKAPIRDVRSHFKAKHPREKMPKAAQMKAIVWRDPRALKNGKQKMVTKRPNFREGYFSSRKTGKEIHYRSGYECQVYELLEQLDEVLTYDTEVIEVPYWFEGEKKTYLPDIYVVFRDGTVELWEIKPASQTGLPMNEAKWDAAKVFCEARGWKFDVKTEVAINKLKKIVRGRV